VVGHRQTPVVFEEFLAVAAFNRFDVDPFAAKWAFFSRFHSLFSINP
jgi:hypothetical protein